jgi:preprotein translocase subunit YajC
MLLANLLVLAEQTTTEPGAPAWVTFLPVIALFFLGYILLMRPAQRQERERRELVSKIKKNDKVINSGGIIGYVDSVKDEEVILKGGLHITKASIVSIVPPSEPSA